MKLLWAFRWWHPLVSVVAAAVIGVVTNLATGDVAPWWLGTALVALVMAQCALAMWQARADQHGKRDARNTLLGPLRPAPPDPPVIGSAGSGGLTAGGRAEARTMVPWLTAAFSPTRLWGRAAVHDRLLDWSVQRDPQAGVVRVVTGPAGVGKSRLALAVAESLPPGWAAGWYLHDSSPGLVERIADAGDPTLVIVDDADRVPSLDALITQSARHPRLIRLLLLARTDTSLRMMPDAVLPQLNRGETLTPVGEAGDRQRWYDDAVHAYARTFRVSPPDLPDKPVGNDEDTPLILHARALLAVLGRAGVRTWALAEIITELVGLEQRTWHADLTQLPAGCDLDVLAEAITVLALLPAPTLQDATDLLRRVLQFAHDTAHETRVALARWARRRYPPGPDHRLNLRPHLIAERLILNTITKTPSLVHDADVSTVAPVLAHAYVSFPDALHLLHALLTRQRNDLPQALAAIFATGVTDPQLDRTLATVLTADITNDDQLRTRLFALNPPQTMPHLRVAYCRLIVAHHRTTPGNDHQQQQHDLAQSLNNLGVELWKVGRYRELLIVDAEAVTIWRGLATAEPDRHRPDLAKSLHRLGISMRGVGRRQDSVAAHEESVALWRQLATAEPDRHRPDLAKSLNGLGAGFQEVGRHQDALAANEEADAIWRELATAEPDRHRLNLAKSLTNLGIALREVGRHQDALATNEEAVSLWRELATAEPDQHRPDLAKTLTSLGITLEEAGRHDEALAANDKAVSLWRELATAEPDQHRRDLAGAVTNFGANLAEAGRHQDALAANEEAVSLWRELTTAEPDQNRPKLAWSLANLAAVYDKTGRIDESLQLRREVVALWRACAEHDPKLYQAPYERELRALQQRLAQLGRDEEAINLDLGN